MNRKLRGDLMLILTALIWGSSFVAQKSGMEFIGPLTFSGMRTLIGGLVLIPSIKLLDRFKTIKASAGENLSDEKKPEDTKNERKTLIKGGILCGIILMAAGNLQQIGLIYTNAGKAGFITALYVIIVPFLGLFLKKKIRPVIWIYVIASAAGLYLLCIPAEGGLGHLNKGDILIFFCAILFAVHIMIIDHFSPKVDGVKMSCIQFFVAGTLSFIFIWIDPLFGFALPTINTLAAAWLPILYAGVLSCGVAYTLQIVAQADADPAIASMILCLESVFAVLTGMIILGETMSMREITGCVIMFAAIIAAQLPQKKTVLPDVRCD